MICLNKKASRNRPIAGDLQREASHYQRAAGKLNLARNGSGAAATRRAERQRVDLAGCLASRRAPSGGRLALASRSARRASNILAAQRYAKKPTYIHDWFVIYPISSCRKMNLTS
jgi:hypothetical protein